MLSKTNGEIPCSDDELLLQLGYKPVLHRGLDGFMNFAFGFTEVAALASVAITLGFGLSTGGPATLVWGFFTNFVMTTLIAYSMAEICGAYPSAGSVYHWAAQLSPREWAPFLSYVTGWLNFLGNTAGDASFATGFASFLSAALAAAGGQVLTAGAQVGISIAVLWVWSILNFVRIDQVGWVNNLAAVIHCGSIIVIIIALIALAPRYNSAEFIFTDYYNGTGIDGASSHSYVGAVGITAGLFAFVGYEASAHMAEETGSATTAAATGIIKTVVATGIAGMSLIIVFCLVTVDLSRVVNDDGSYGGPCTGNAAVNLFIASAGKEWGQAMAWLILINLFFAGVSSVAVTGRITFSLARDGAFPCSDRISEISVHMKSPVNAIMFVCLCDSCLQLIPLDTTNGAVAFNAIIGLTVVGFQLSYALPIFFKVIFPQPTFPRTAMDLGSWSIPLGILGSTWLFGSSCLLFFPIEGPPGVSTMNWLCVVVGGVAVLGGLNWHFNSRHHFSGPKRAEDSCVQLNPLGAVSEVDQLGTVEIGSSGGEIEEASAIADRDTSFKAVNE